MRALGSRTASATTRGPDPVIRCLITNGQAARDQTAWLDRLAHWLERGIELVQLRERDLTDAELTRLTRRVMSLPNPHRTKILLNGRADIARLCGTHGVHLRDSGDDPAQFRRPGFLVSAACHTVEGVDRLAAADYIVLAPIFEPLSKTGVGLPLGLAGLRAAAARTTVPILALGGVTPDNEQRCIEAGAAGIAGISYFGDIEERA